MTEAASRIAGGACIYELFEIQAGLTPSAPAVLCAGARLSYRDLNRRANQLARHLRSLGVTCGTIVGVCLERSLETSVALLGVLKAGGAYLPLDPGHPRARLAFMFENSRAEIVVTDTRSAASLPAARHTIRLDADRAQLDGYSADDLPHAPDPRDPVYVMYTSGSTGRPKGVVGLHRGAVNRLTWMWRTYPFLEDEVCCQKTSFTFVDSVAELFGPLLKGVPTVIAPDEVVKDPSRFVDLLESAQVTRLVLVPSLLRDVLAVGGLRERLRHLRICVSSGEPLPLDLCRHFLAVLPHATLLNLYGSTEVSADVTCYDTWQLPDDAASVPLGRPIDNTRVYVLDDQLKPVADGEPGELFVAGDGLAQGYWDRPELTAERFLANPFAGDRYARLYRTGDRARVLPDGNLELLGRVDRQVKIRGVRVELSEVEAVLSAHADVAQAVVATRQDAGALRLVGYLVARSATVVQVDELRAFCRERLPVHMVPSAFVQLPALPLTPSGKVDRLALPASESARTAYAASARVRPRTPVEERLTAIWQQLLGFTDVGVTDDFFDLGGHSLLAVRLFLEIETQFDRRLSVSVLTEAPTIERLARILSQPQEPQPWSPLIELQRLGTRPPFFLVHGIGGEVLSFAPLARRLAPDQPVYGLRARGSDGDDEPFADVEGMAACYVDAIKRVAPDGPYLLGGYSSGGTIALEMARQFRANGDAVSLLAMIDSEAPGPDRSSAWHPRVAGAYVRNLASWIVDDDFLRSPMDDKMARLRSRGRLLRSRMRSLVFAEDGGADVRDLLGVWRVSARHRAFLEAHSRALAGYAPHMYTGPMTLIRARTLRLTAWAPPDLGWRPLAKGGLDIRMVPGAHDNILAEPRVEALAQQLRECLRLAQESARAATA